MQVMVRLAYVVSSPPCCTGAYHKPPFRMSHSLLLLLPTYLLITALPKLGHGHLCVLHVETSKNSKIRMLNFCIDGRFKHGTGHHDS